MLTKDTLHRVQIHGDPKIVKGIPDPGISPGVILGCHLYRKFGNPVSHPRPPRASLGRSIVFSGDEGLEPTQKRIRRHDTGELFEHPPP